MPSRLLSVAMLFFPSLQYPFEPIQLTLISALTVGVPSFFLSLESNRERIHGNFVHTIFTRAFPSALAVSVSALILMFTQKGSDAGSTLATVTTAAIGLITLIKLCLPMNRRRAALIAIMAGLITAAMLFFPSVFSLVKPEPRQMLLALSLAAAGAIVIFALPLLIKKLPARVKRFAKRG